MNSKARELLVLIVLLLLGLVYANATKDMYIGKSVFAGLMMLIPSVIYLGMRKKKNWKKVIVSTMLFGGLFGFIFEFIAEFNKAYSVVSVLFPFKVFGVLPLDTVVSTYQHDIPQTASHKEYFLSNETNLLSTYPGVKGVKTGYTPEAGLCLVTYYEKDGLRLIGVLLNSPNRRGEMKELLDYALKQSGKTPPEDI